ncbi:Metallo-dependent phosphatase-like protein [Fusarium redolens]|uniref:Purple acid phosphatase n=1 Tax=Fusarium redolens TaxID=48865 RepID=A0A9P9FXR8_FUSRE|nr:Metallo-dependent phosphatase-like protein [Fusarium redolens]KAH7220446.1 Metallo-dependent phosphatase-like protein [Fusarium redolens]
MKLPYLFAVIIAALSQAAPTVDEKYPYLGPKVPIGDWVDPTINGHGKGFPRLVEPPATGGATVGINIYYQTPFGLGVAPSVYWGTSPSALNNVATGLSVTYDRAPPCSLINVIEQLQPGTTYFYQIPAANGTTQSTVLSFTTAQATGNPSQFTMNDDEGLAFIWHGRDLSYADNWYSGVIQCNASSWPVCYNGSSSHLPNNDTNPDYFDTPLPAHEIPNQGSPRGGDVGVLYESNWDLWQQWMNTITMKIPYIVLPGNHEATCADHDNSPYVLSSYLNENKPNTTMSDNNPNNRYFMAGEKSGGIGNFWHSFDYGLVHFVSIDTETDYVHSPDKTFLEDIEKAKEEEDCNGKDKDFPKCKPKQKETDTYECKTINLGDETDLLAEEIYFLSGKTHPLANETHITDAGPFGTINGSIKDNKAYEQYQWLKKDLARVDRCKTPWVIIMGHRPMYSSKGGNYHEHLREAFEKLFLKHKADLYISGHVHWYERLKPIRNCAVDSDSIIDTNTYEVNPGYSMVHLINGAAGNIESHSTANMSQLVPSITAVRDLTSFGFSKLTVYNATTLSWQFIQGQDGLVGDELSVLKDPSLACEGYSSYSSPGSSGSSCSSECSGSGLLSWIYCNIYCSSFWGPLKF